MSGLQINFSEFSKKKKIKRVPKFNVTLQSFETKQVCADACVSIASVCKE